MYNPLISVRRFDCSCYFIKYMFKRRWISPFVF